MPLLPHKLDFGLEELLTVYSLVKHRLERGRYALSLSAHWDHLVSNLTTNDRGWKDWYFFAKGDFIFGEEIGVLSFWKLASVPDIGNATLEATNHQDFVHDRTSSLQLVNESSDYLNESLKLENEIDEVLQALRKSQELEYKIAEDQLYAQKNYLHNLYQQLDRERSALAHRRTSHIETVSLLAAISNRLVQVNREIMKLREMEEVAKGFGKTPNHILKEHFGM